MPPPLGYVEDAFSPFTAFLKQRGLDKEYRTPAEQYQASQFAPLASAYNVGSRFAGLGGGGAGPGASFEGFLGTPQGAEGNVYGGAQNALNQIFSGGLPSTAPPEDVQAQRSRAGSTYEGGLGNIPSQGGAGGMGELQQLVYAALRGRIGEPGAAWVASKISAGGAGQDWMSQQAGGGTGSFLDFLKSRYNLGV